MPTTVCGIPELTADIALQKVAAVEVVSKETEEIREATSGATSSSDVHKTGMATKCHRCGKVGHHPSACKYKSVKCYLCQKVGHLSQACRTKKKDKPDKLDRKAGGIRAIEEQDNHSSSDSLEHLHSILQLGTKSENFLINVKINGISIEMEIDSGAEGLQFLYHCLSRK